RDDLSIASLDILGGLVRLDAGGTLTLPAAAIDTGGYDLELFSRGGALQTGGALTGADVRLWGGDGITLGHDVTATGTLRLDSGAGIAQSAGTLAAGVLQVDAAGPVALGSWNAVQALGAIDVEGNLLLRNTPAITQTALGSITVEGAATFASGGA